MPESTQGCELGLVLPFDATQGVGLDRSCRSAFQLVQSFESSTERMKTHRMLARELTFHGRQRYANTILYGLGEAADLQCIPGWLESILTRQYAYCQSY